MRGTGRGAQGPRSGGGAGLVTSGLALGSVSSEGFRGLGCSCAGQRPGDQGTQPLQLTLLQRPLACSADGVGPAPGRSSPFLLSEVVLVAATCGTLCGEAHLPRIRACISWQQDFGVRVSFLPGSQRALQALNQALRGGWWASPGCGEHIAYQATPPRAVSPGTCHPGVQGPGEPAHHCHLDTSGRYDPPTGT